LGDAVKTQFDPGIALNWRLPVGLLSHFCRQFRLASAKLTGQTHPRAPVGPGVRRVNLATLEFRSLAHPPKTSELLSELRDAFVGEDPITVREVLSKLDRRAFGLLLLLLALPNCIPNIPGISTIFGVMLLAPGLQMIFGAGTVWLPKQLANMEVKPDTVRRAIDVALPRLQSFETFVRPRLEFLTERPFTILSGVQVVILAGVLILPIPLGNWPPGMSVAALAIGLIQRDGVMTLISIGLFIVSLLILPLGIGAGLAALNWTVDYLVGAFNFVFGG
jgi:hypothetical protein